MMNKNVQPIRSLEDIRIMKDALMRHCSYRDYFLFVFGINVGLRITDILPLRVNQVKNRNFICVNEKKTGQFKEIYISRHLKEEIDRYTAPMDPDDLLFPSRKGNSHITPTQAYRTLQKAAEMCGIDYVGSRTLRKTFGFHHYKKHKDLATLQKFFSHSHPKITKEYIGIPID